MSYNTCFINLTCLCKLNHLTGSCKLNHLTGLCKLIFTNYLQLNSTLHRATQILHYIRMYTVSHILIFKFVSWALYTNKCGSFCMNRTTFRDMWVGGVFVKTYIIALRRSTFLKEKTIHHVTKFSFLFGLTDS